MKQIWRRRDIILLLERLELYIGAGLPLDKALAVSGQGQKERQRACLNSVRRCIESGGLLSKGLYEFVRISPTTAGLIEHGESSGELAKALSAGRALLEREDELRKKCLGAMAYPVIIGLFASLLTIGLIRGVMPQIIPMLKSLHVELPLLTRAVIALSEGLSAYGLYAGALMAAVCIAAKVAYRRLRMVKMAAQASLLRVPIVGRLIFHYSLAVFLRSCGALVESGSPVERSYKSTAGSVSLLPLCEHLLSRADDVGRGVPISTVLSHAKVPSYISPLLAAGEASGTLGISIGRAAGILDRDIEHALKRLTALIEPVMMAGMGTAVGAIALSIMMPIYDISKVLQK